VAIPNSSARLVLVELFTSEGCSSCPPADKALTFLQTQQPVSGAGIITLAYHVDYWDRLGWKDRFSSAEYSQRQNDYSQRFTLDSIYTPQMIVDGTTEFVGSNLEKATGSIAGAATLDKAGVTAAVENGNIRVIIEKIQDHEAATVYLAVAEDRIATDVKSGENRGRRLEHSSVVRELQSIGTVRPETSSFNAEVPLPKNAEWATPNLRYVIFVQENVNRKVIAVGQASAAG